MDDFYVRFWGVRGSIATSDPGTVRYGGNTSSLEIGCGGRLLLFDAGTGLRYLGNRMVQSAEPLDFDLFLTHTHFDHICGLPFFRPFFRPDARVRIHAGHLVPEMTIQQALTELMMAPLFPVPPSIFTAKVSFVDFRAGDSLRPAEGIRIRTAPLNHPNRATGYRVEYGGRSICYVTDTEHLPGELDEAVLALIRGCDVFIYDSMFTEAEHAERVGWGHSTWQAGARLADAAGVGLFVVFHHDPDHDDLFLDEVARRVGAARAGSIVAYEGLTLRP